MPRSILAGAPRLAGAIEHVLCAQDIGLEKQARVGDAAVHMALGREVDDIVHVVVTQDVLHQFAVTHIASDEGDIGAFYLLLDGSQVAGISQGVEDDDLDVVAILVEDVFHKVRADKTCGSRDEISLHNIVTVLINVQR